MRMLLNCLHNLRKEETSCNKKTIVILEIINTVMEQETSKQLSKENLEKLLCCLHSNDTKVLMSCLTILLLTTDKSKQLSQHCLEKMMGIFNSERHPHEEVTSFVVFILSRTMCSDENFPKVNTSVILNMLK